MSQLTVTEQLAIPAAEPERLTLLSRCSVFLAGVLDSVSFLFFCLSFSSVTHLLSSWWDAVLPEE